MGIASRRRQQARRLVKSIQYAQRHHTARHRAPAMAGGATCNNLPGRLAAWTVARPSWPVQLTYARTLRHWSSAMGRGSMLGTVSSDSPDLVPPGVSVACGLGATLGPRFVSSMPDQEVGRYPCRTLFRPVAGENAHQSHTHRAPRKKYYFILPGHAQRASVVQMRTAEPLRAHACVVFKAPPNKATSAALDSALSDTLGRVAVRGDTKCQYTAHRLCYGSPAA